MAKIFGELKLGGLKTTLLDSGKFFIEFAVSFV